MIAEQHGGYGCIMCGPRCAAPGKKSRYLQKRGIICPAYAPQNSVLRIGPLFVQAQIKQSFKCQFFSSFFPLRSPAPKHSK